MSQVPLIDKFHVFSFFLGLYKTLAFELSNTQLRVHVYQLTVSSSRIALYCISLLYYIYCTQWYQVDIANYPFCYIHL